MELLAIRTLTVVYHRKYAADAVEKIRVLCEVLFNIRIFVGLFDVERERATEVIIA
jgi:hypothetical protein